MVVLETTGIGVAFAASAPVLRDVSFRLSPGWYGLVGANGAGKTTLLRLAAGQLTPTEGSLRIEPKDALVALCEQDVETVSTDVATFAEADDGVSAELRGRLALDVGQIDRWPTLSPGERKRWQIGAALAREPDILLLDEPTNHLDSEARSLLVRALARFRGIGLVVSHDRALLEDLPRAILRVHDARVTLHPGAYSDAANAWELERRGREDAHARAKRRVEVASARLDAARREQASADLGRSSRVRMKDKNDNDARSFGAKIHAGWAEARASRTVGVVRGELERAEGDVPVFVRDRTLGGRVFAKFERAPMPVLFHVDHEALDVGGTTILHDVRLSIGRDERVRIAGANGAGKTTLLEALLTSRLGENEDGRQKGQAPRETPASVRGRASRHVLYLPQELGREAVLSLARELRELDDEERGRVLAVFAALGSDPERIVFRRPDEAALLSPGEARKLALSLGLGRNAWALVLDEPTNHMDLPSIERLEQALLAYPGSLLLVTHDDVFARTITTRTLLVENGTVT